MSNGISRDQCYLMKQTHGQIVMWVQIFASLGFHLNHAVVTLSSLTSPVDSHQGDVKWK